MLRLATTMVIGLALIGAGWILGSIFPAPSAWTSFVRGRAAPIAAQLDLSPTGLEQLRSSLSPRQLSQLTGAAVQWAASSGEVIRVDRSDASVDEHAIVEAVSSTAPRPITAGADVFETTLQLCPGMTVSNAPAFDNHEMVRNYARLVTVNGVVLAANPTQGACLSSGFGSRGGRLHKGLDFHSPVGGPIFAAADGTVLEQLYRSDYGNMVLLDHGGGVYTRYAHLSSFATGLSVGSRVSAGQQLGLMGNTAGYPIPVHLHYELLLGDYNTQRRSFGLTPHSPLGYPPAAATIAAAAPATAAPPPEQSAAFDAFALIRQAFAPHCPDGPITDATAITVRRGETLSAIARECYGRDSAWPLVVACNPFLEERNRGGVSPLYGGDLLYVGDRLMLPSPDGRCPT